MLMKQSKMQFQEIQISSLDNGCPEQLQNITEKVMEQKLYRLWLVFALKRLNLSDYGQKLMFVMWLHKEY